jgi:hypothetical protein
MLATDGTVYEHEIGQSYSGATPYAETGPPNGVETTHGTYSTANPTSVRFQGRQVRMKVEANQNADWRVGVMRLDARQGSRR